MSRHFETLSYEDTLEVEREVELEIMQRAFLEELEKWDEALERMLECAFDAYPSLREMESESGGEVSEVEENRDEE